MKCAVLTSSTAVVVVDGANAATVDGIRDALRHEFTLDAALSVITAGGLAGLPDFVCAAAEGEAIRVLARGALSVVVERSAEEAATVAAAPGAVTWREELLFDVASVAVVHEGDVLLEWLTGEANSSDRSHPMSARAQPETATARPTAASTPTVASDEEAPPTVADPPSSEMGSAVEIADADSGDVGVAMPSVEKNALPTPRQDEAGTPPDRSAPGSPLGGYQIGASLSPGLPSATSAPLPEPATSVSADDADADADADAGSDHDLDEPASQRPLISAIPLSDSASGTEAPAEGSQDDDDVSFDDDVDDVDDVGGNGQGDDGEVGDAIVDAGQAVVAESESGVTIDSGPTVMRAADPDPASTSDPAAPGESGSASDDVDEMTIIAGRRGSAVHESVPEPEVETDADAAGLPLEVPARRCADGHANPPDVETCRLCGSAVGGDVAMIDRPSLARLAFDNGMIVEVDRPQIVGRDPRPPASDTTGEPPGYIAIPDPNRDLSRSHVLVRLDGWTLSVADLGSTNGTMVTNQGQSPVRLRPDEPIALADGSEVVLGEVVSFVVEPPSG